MRNLRIAELLFNRPLMVSEGKLNMILHALGPRFNLDLNGFPKAEMAEISEQERRRAGYRVQGGVGVIGVYGPLMHRLLASDYPSGGPTTYSEIRRAFDLALVDDAVQSIVLDLDSPGGEVHGVFDLADHIFQARGIKPITAVVNESAFSAGYLLASAASRIVIPRTGGAGSIGVIATHADFSRAEEAAGITVTHVFAGARKADFSPHQPLGTEAMVTLQAMVDDTYALFVETVARNRGMKTKEVRETEAGIFEGKKAVEAKFADEVSAADKAILNSGKRKTIISASGRSAAAGKEQRTMTLRELREQHPELVSQIEAEARQGMITQAAADAARGEAVTAERGRVLAILSIPGPAATAHKALLMEGIESGKSAGDVALAIQHKEAELLGQAADGMQKGAAKPAPPADPGSSTPAETQAAAAGDAMVKAAEAWAIRN